VLCSCPFWHYIRDQTEAIILHMLLSVMITKQNHVKYCYSQRA
jgi:hypothetical protein